MDKLHIFFLTDINEYFGVIACISSIIKNTKNLEKINFHILTYNLKEKLNFIVSKHEYLKYYSQYIEIFELTSFQNKLDELKELMAEHDKSYINNIANFSRFLIPLIYKNIAFGLYMDADMIVQDDIYNIIDNIDINNFCLAAVPNYTFKKMELMQFEEPAFNAGIYLQNFDFFRKNKLYKEIKKLMYSHKFEKKWKLGTQPILNIIYYKKVTFLDDKWNVVGLGEKNTPKLETIKNAIVLHWTGENKPWKLNAQFKDIWKKYNKIKIQINENPEKNI